MYFFNDKIVQLNKKIKAINRFFSTVNGLNSTKASISLRIKQELAFSHVATITGTWESHFVKLWTYVLFHEWQSPIIIQTGHEDEISYRLIKRFFGWDANSKSNSVSVKQTK